jgi:acetyltransferase-like isoleucine patch superfamily enzyme
VSSKLSKALNEPWASIKLIAAIAKGHFYRIWLPLCGRRFTVGRNFKVFGTLDVRGPGYVVFGDNVTIGMCVTPYTHDVKATITIGNHCFLNGTRFGCKTGIEIGDDCILAEARIMDTNFHSTRSDRWNPEAPVTTKSVRIERNVWIAADVAILPGTTVGENCVIGIGSICSGTYPKDSLITGNPARVVRKIEHPDD